ncbi:MAG: ABC transporter ATP-binding protein, partial [Pyrinomonadaceae bacterium]
MEEFRRLLKYIRPLWPSFALAFVAMLVVAIFETAITTLLGPIFEQLLPTDARQTKLPFNIQNLIPRDDWFRGWIAISVLLISFTILKGIAEFLSSFLMARIGQKAIFQLRTELYEHLLAQSTEFFERHRTNFLVSRLVVSCAAIEGAVSHNIRDVLRESLTLICFLTAAFYYNWRLMLGAITIGPVIAYLTVRFSRLFRRFATESLEGNKQLTDTAQETLSNHTIVKAYQAEEREKSRFRNIAAVIARANMRTGRIASLSPPILEFIGYLAIVVLFYFGLREINSGRMVAGEFISFLFLLFRSYDPMRKLSRQHNELSRAFAAAKDVWSVMDENSTLPENKDAVKLQELRDKITLENVSFGYGKSKKSVLRSIDLEIPKGETIALVGESGGGKSSMIKLVQRLYDPASGKITWDGVDLCNAQVASLRQRIALVSQETVLFNDTILYNISYGDPEASIDDVRSAAKTAFADEFIRELPGGYDTLVGERCVFLSGGQRQR